MNATLTEFSATGTTREQTSLALSAINRRDFLKTSALAVAGATLGGLDTVAEASKTYRVGLIGTGWYGKSDLFRLIQVAPVEVVSLCDVDKQMVAGAAEMVAGRQKSRK